MNNTVFDPIAGIASERDAVRAFIDVLRREQRALQQADVSVLLPLAVEKASHAQQLAGLTEAREQWLGMSGSLKDQGDMERRLADHPTAAMAWQELLQLTETAHRINEINGILVNQRLRYNQQRLSALQAAARGLHNGLYGSNGQPQIFSGGRRLGEI
ncbi:flagella synthesis protein FlgN [Nitrosospira multiformis]|uniref:FlgN n=1 Tax=Nitrosospira multiformis (strain ATCC 25196 / NCIMB 11849 / C 71) TaxID=323848 RepID=Q2Y9F2_NITMU|nr:flagellar protein FlgN [Nitrosospira multiformis]ABB74619.1 FlgN [Nitrosospira multiformis ATCC 25196]SDZ83114.1 flagella synthesis protein FlgN [Nitrosospira multiformis]SEG16051.1 flagella synthesis protein FlgN [Nitrosospira multiformis ATCC 25196]